MRTNLFMKVIMTLLALGLASNVATAKTAADVIQETVKKDAPRSDIEAQFGKPIVVNIDEDGNQVAVYDYKPDESLRGGAMESIGKFMFAGGSDFGDDGYLRLFITYNNSNHVLSHEMGMVIP